MIHFYFLYLYRLNLFLKIKNVLFIFIIFLIYAALHNIFFILFNKFYVCVDLCYRLILIKKNSLNTTA
jgi:hypothetical protein